MGLFENRIPLKPLDHNLLSKLLFFWYHPFSGICSTSWLPSLIQRGCWASRVKRKVIPLLIEVNISRYKESIVMVGWPYPIYIRYIVSNSTFWTWHMCSSCVFFYMVCARILSQCCETFQHHGSFGNSYPLAIQHGHGDGPFGPFADDFAVKNGGFPRGYHHRIPPEGTTRGYDTNPY